MKQRNKALLKETFLEYNGDIEDNGNYEKIEQFLEALYIEGICDEVELQAYENLSYTGKCKSDEFEYVVESMELWSEDEYFRRLDIVNGK